MSVTTTDPATSTAASASAGRRPRLGGLTWLVWRQHRAAFWTWLGVTAAALAWVVYQRAQVHPGGPGGLLEIPGYDSAHDAALALGFFMPLLAGVFLGAPLITHDLEHGTGKLVMSQSVSRGHWLAVKFGMTVLVAAVCSVALSAAYTWWLDPVAEKAGAGFWASASATGPMPVALTLFTLVSGVAAGLVLRRTLLSMTVAFGLGLAVQGAWAKGWTGLGDSARVTTESVDAGIPQVPDSDHGLDESYITDTGQLLDWGNCAKATEQATAACLERKGVVGWSVEYLPASELSPLVWTGAAILLALTVAVTGFIFWWGRKRLY